MGLVGLDYDQVCSNGNDVDNEEKKSWFIENITRLSLLFIVLVGIVLFSLSMFFTIPETIWFLVALLINIIEMIARHLNGDMVWPYIFMIIIILTFRP